MNAVTVRILRLPLITLQSKVNGMESKWAEENLQTIRTLMERSAVYRRALAPIMLLAGIFGVTAATFGILCHLDSMRMFGVLWMGTAASVIIGAFLIARKQALKDSEPFWSPPTRRVAEALLPPLMVGMCLGVVFIVPRLGSEFDTLITLLWLLFYGLALCAAGFFMPRGMKIFGWFFIIAASLLFTFIGLTGIELPFSAHWLMGFFFGALHLAYGAYLYLTEGKNPVA